jgi:hypothetical protein
MKQSLLTITVLTLALSIGTSHAQEKPKAHPMEAKGSTVKEVDSFHELLHPLVHEAYPNNDFASIRKALPGLITSAAALNKARLPKELSEKKEAYGRESKKLMKQLKQLNGKKMPDEQFGKLFAEMHDTFENIMEIVR